MPDDVKAIVVDIETSGLEVDTVALFEIGMIAIDERFEIVDTFERICVDRLTLNTLHHLEALAKDHVEGASYEEVKSAGIVFAMHQESGLWGRLERAANARQYTEAKDISAAAIAWLRSHGANGLPMTGSNVANFDRPVIRRRLPSLEAEFHYRNVDVSSIKEWLRAYSPDLYDRLQVGLVPKGLHRAVSDCCDTRDQLRSYTRNLLG